MSHPKIKRPRNTEIQRLKRKKASHRIEVAVSKVYDHIGRQLISRRLRRWRIRSRIDPELLDDVRGFVDDPQAWFETPNIEFEGRKPIDLLGTDDELWLRNRIMGANFGMFS